MKTDYMTKGCKNTFFQQRLVQCMVEIAFILQLLVLLLVKVLDPGTAFLTFITILNAAFGGALVAMLWLSEPRIIVNTTCLAYFMHNKNRLSTIYLNL
jgi:hypothetical protein